MVEEIIPHIKTNRKIGLAAWERFEELADKHETLWNIFWGIAHDKKKIKERDICAIVYFQKFILPAVETIFSELVHQKEIDKNDVEITLSLFLKLIPNEKCKNCDCLEKIKKNKLFEHNHSPL